MNVVVVGAGAIGSPLVCGLLQWPEVEHLWVVDGDRVERSNLPRQPWYQLADLGQFKAAALANALGDRRIHPVVEVVGEAFSWPPADIVFDATDNWPARQAIQREARRRGIPWVFSSAVRWEGQVAFMRPQGPCLACLFGEDPGEGLRCFEAGVVGTVTLAVAGQALAVAKAWQAHGEQWEDRLYLLDGRTGDRWWVRLPPRECPHGT
ncbi:MAG: ThiF family adenylyltransferase [Firmicutes bacterium]|nr:ThiF family adenylyltransferase [Bacillota bacterium]